jgi:RNA polymerase sigma-70 factor (ECF subfamily)
MVLMGWFGLRKQRDAERDFMERVFVHWDAMYRYALRLSGSESEAHDLVQDAMAKALKHFDRVRPDTNYRAWVFTIVRNAFVSRMRKSGRESLLEDADTIAREPEPEVGSALEALGGDRFKEGFEDEVLHALQQLPEAQRTALVLCDIEGLDYEGIAHVLDCPVGTVRSRIHHARKKLKAALTDYARTRGYRDVESHG